LDERDTRIKLDSGYIFSCNKAIERDTLHIILLAANEISKFSKMVDAPGEILS
jgi:hypothetical protein